MILLASVIPLRFAYCEDLDGVLTGEFLVGLKGVDGDLTSTIDKSHFEVVRKMEQINVLLVRAKDDMTTQEVKDAIAVSQLVNFVEPNYLVKLPPMEFGPIIEASQIRGSSLVMSTSIPNDPLWSWDKLTGIGQWNMRVIDVDGAWNIHMGSKDVIVSVIDSGIFWGHHDLEANYMPGGHDWVNDDDDPNDDNGHGSWTAGIIAAETNNSYGVAGLAQVSIMAEKVLRSDGTGSIADVSSALLHSADLGADVINMSFGTDSYSQALEDAVNYAHERGCLLVAAAGNKNRDRPHYPAAYDNVMAIASTYGEPNDFRAPYSNYGSWIAVSAPGGFDRNRNGYPNTGEHWITSTNNKQDTFLMSYGTSAATPHVSGLAALYKSRFPTVTNVEIDEVLKNTADDKGKTGWDELYGYGRINAYEALSSSLIISVGGEGEIISLSQRSISAQRIGITTLTVFGLICILIIKLRTLPDKRAQT